MIVFVADTFYPTYNQLLDNLPQGIVLHGKKGVGLRTIATELGGLKRQVSVIEPELLSKTSTVPQIGIEVIKALYTATRTSHRTGRCIIIDDADTMTLPAQNAFLKLLEEPNDDTKFILTSHNPEQLLATIRSRVAAYFVPSVEDEKLSALLEPVIDETRRRQLLFLADGRPAELLRLIQDEDYFRSVAAEVGLAKRLVESSKYDVVATIVAERFSRGVALSLVERSIMLLEREATPESVTRIKRLITAHERLSGGGSVSLQLARAMV